MFNQNDPYGQYRQYNQTGSAFSVFTRLFALGMGLILLLVGAGILIYMLVQGEPLIPTSFDDGLNLEVFKPLIMIILAGAAGLAGILLIIGPRGRRVAGRVVHLVFTVAFFLGIAATLFWSIFINPNVDITGTGFTRTSVSITEGDTLHFKNPSNGIAQILCIGVDQHCKTSEGAPDALNKGLKIEPGQTVDVTFWEVGTWTITSQNTPHMNISIKINAHHTSSSSSSRRRH